MLSSLIYKIYKDSLFKNDTLKSYYQSIKSLSTNGYKTFGNVIL